MIENPVPSGASLFAGAVPLAEQDAERARRGAKVISQALSLVEQLLIRREVDKTAAQIVDVAGDVQAGF